MIRRTRIDPDQKTAALYCVWEDETAVLIPPSFNLMLAIPFTDQVCERLRRV